MRSNASSNAAATVRSVYPRYNRLVLSITDPCLDIVLGLQSGELATLRSCDASQFSVFEMDVMGTKGRVRLVDSCHVINHDRVADSSRYSGFRELVRNGINFGNQRDLMLHAVEDLVEAVRTGRPPACTGADGLAAVAIGCAADRSAKTGKRVTLNY